MSSLNSEQPVQAPSFTPSTDSPPDPQTALAGVDASFETFPTAVDLVVAASPPAPVGRSWSFSWPVRQFRRGLAQTPMPTRGTRTLSEWLEKALRTSRGAHPVHPPGYGIPGDPTEAVSRPIGYVPPDLFERVRSAATFHPRIADIVDFTYSYDRDDEVLKVSFTVELDDGSEMPVDNMQIAL